VGEDEGEGDLNFLAPGATVDCDTFISSPLTREDGGEGNIRQ
jgi:hypothetical protein